MSASFFMGMGVVSQTRVFMSGFYLVTSGSESFMSDFTHVMSEFRAFMSVSKQVMSEFKKPSNLPSTARFLQLLMLF